MTMSWAIHSEQTALALSAAREAPAGSGRRRRLVKLAWQHAQRCKDLSTNEREHAIADRALVLLQEIGEAGALE